MSQVPVTQMSPVKSWVCGSRTEEKDLDWKYRFGNHQLIAGNLNHVSLHPPAFPTSMDETWRTQHLPLSLSLLLVHKIHANTKKQSYQSLRAISLKPVPLHLHLCCLHSPLTILRLELVSELISDLPSQTRAGVHTHGYGNRAFLKHKYDYVNPLIKNCQKLPIT